MRTFGVELIGYDTVPEPGTAGVVVIAAIGLLARRRRRCMRARSFAIPTTLFTTYESTVHPLKQERVPRTLHFRAGRVVPASLSPRPYVTLT